MRLEDWLYHRVPAFHSQVRETLEFCGGDVEDATFKLLALLPEKTDDGAAIGYESVRAVVEGF